MKLAFFTLLLTPFFAASCGGSVNTLETPKIFAAPPIVQSPGESGDYESIRIGSFERPENVPRYEIIEETDNSRDGVRALRFLVDTEVSRESEFKQIARDLKARYSDYDAVSAEVTDTSRGFDYNGAILIFNTPEGSYFMGFLYSPPSNDGFIVDVAAEE